MPTKAPTFRSAGAQGKRAYQRDQDRGRRKSQPWRKWYSRRAWQIIRDRELTNEPYCMRCARDGRQVLATVVNHLIPHRGDWNLFIAGPFESVCKACHDGPIQAEERACEG